MSKLAHLLVKLIAFCSISILGGKVKLKSAISKYVIIAGNFTINGIRASFAHFDVSKDRYM